MEKDDKDQQDDHKPQKKPAKHDFAAGADLEKVTDYEEEKEISSQNIAGAMTLINDKRSKEVEKKNAQAKELAKVVIRKEDVELIIREMEISRSQAELKLRENLGDVVNALINLTD